ncbi:MAG TPA: hypothetical protein P5026_07955 [Kiritimatiellia bacterium]|nr:hypothetical protein [Kiritimatiellia bacterium]HRU10238.1 hypothetical protein [Thermoanaerobaculia bacterium]
MGMHFSGGKLVMSGGKFLNCCCGMGNFRMWYGYKPYGLAAVYHVDLWYDPSTHTFIGGAGGGELVPTGCVGTTAPIWSYTLATSGSGPLIQWGARRTVGGTTTNILIGLLIDPLSASKGATWQLGSGNGYTINCAYPASGPTEDITVYVEKLTAKTWTLS